MSGEAILVAIFVGVFAGWLVHVVSQGTGLPLIGSLAVGAVGGIFGEFFIPYTGLSPGLGNVSVAINGGIGAALVLLIFKLVRPDDDREPFKQDGGKR